MAVFQGEVDLSGPLGQVAVRKGSTLKLPADNPAGYALTHKIEPEASDTWDRERQNDLEASAHIYKLPRVYENEAYPYGLAGLSASGAFQNIPAYGYVWQPTGVGRAEPFLNGTWCYYPVFGWTFIGAYPWAWVPYHYGQWVFVPGRGWVWTLGTGGLLMPWRPVVPLSNPAVTVIPQPPRPGRRIPAGPGSTLVVRNGVPQVQQSVPQATSASAPSARINPREMAPSGIEPHVPGNSLPTSATPWALPHQHPAISAGSTFEHGTNLTDRRAQPGLPKFSPPVNFAVPSRIPEVRAVPAPQIRPLPLIQPLPALLPRISPPALPHVSPGFSPGVTHGQIGIGAPIGHPR